MGIASQPGVNRPRILRDFKTRRHAHGQCVADALAAAERTCAARGQRLTALRRRVLELVWVNHEPIKAYDILARLRDERARAAPPTVYRALEFLRGEGLVHRIESLNAFVGCGAPAQAHRGQFLICSQCGTVAELDDGELSAVIVDRAARMGFQVERETIEIVGRCMHCRV